MGLITMDEEVLSFNMIEHNHSIEKYVYCNMEMTHKLRNNLTKSKLKKHLWQVDE